MKNFWKGQPECQEFSNGSKEWVIEMTTSWGHTRMVKHRLDGPAKISPHREEWYVYGKRHRLDGPAVYLRREIATHPAGHHGRWDDINRWYINGWQLTFAKFQKALREYTPEQLMSYEPPMDVNLQDQLQKFLQNGKERHAKTLETFKEYYCVPHLQSAEIEEWLSTVIAVDFEVPVAPINQAKWREDTRAQWKIMENDPSWEWKPGEGSGITNSRGFISDEISRNFSANLSTEPSVPYNACDEKTWTEDDFFSGC